MTPPVQPLVPPAGPPAPPRSLTGQDLNTRVAHGDPAFPKELWGKTLAEAMRFYAIMREDFMRRNDPRQVPLAGEPAGGQPAPAPAPAPRGYQPPAAPPAPAGSAFDMSSIEAMVAKAVSQAIAPLVTSQAETVHDRMRREIPDWMTYEQEVLEALAQTPPNLMSDPDTWRTAYYFVKGRKFSQPNGGPPAPPAAPAGGYRDPYAAAEPVRTPPPAPPVTGQPFFAEGPSAPPPNPGEISLAHDPRVIGMARRFGMSVEEYLQWYGGRVPPMAPSNGGGHA